ncbi:MAG: response regulator [Gemmatimonadetes bacterium]|nr:response regulator [Gemmatimonadota bacterium]NNM05853.1 response regulator [Gemmatimonadota bacterium]
MPSPGGRLRAPELLQPRLAVLTAGLMRLERGEQEGAGTIRRMGKVFLNWAIGEGLENVEKAAFDLVGADDADLLEFGSALRAQLKATLSSMGPEPSQHFVVLVVEDDPTDVIFLELALQAPDRTIHTVSTLAEAQEILDREEVALLMTDLYLPDGDGRTLLAHVRDQERYIDLPLLVVSGHGTPDVKAECLALGAQSFFEKPVDPTAIATTVSSCLHAVAKRRLNETTDALTHLLKRNVIRDLWDRWTFPDPSSVGIVGLDGFRKLEERFDHEIADSVLASVGTLIRDAVPKGSVAARWEEAEFLLLCPGLNRQATSGLLQKILDAIRDLTHRDPRGESFRVTASGGVVEITSGAVFDDAVEEAYALLEEAFESGGNTLAETAGADDAATILVAEDDPLSAGILIHRLEKEGFNVLHFPDGSEALEGALANQISMAILDVKMPGMDGFELLERLRKVPAYYGLPIMMLTSMGREEDIARGFDLGADDYMVKPFSPVEVLARVRRLLKR